METVEGEKKQSNAVLHGGGWKTFRVWVDKKEPRGHRGGVITHKVQEEI